MTSWNDGPAAEGVDPRWLDAVPRLARHQADVIVLRGCLLRAATGRVRFAIGESCFEFGVEDVLDARELSAAGDAAGSAAIPVELYLRPGASLLAVHDLEALQAQASAGAVPFAVAARPGRLIGPSSPAFAAVEASYMKRHGLTSDDPDPRAG
jgi:hypothetical protein